jgi:SAM-dependent methyltransferase
MPRWIRQRLDGFRTRHPLVYWRGRNAVALGEWWLSRRRLQRNAAAGDAYSEAFWDFHDGGAWKAFAEVVLRHCPARSIVDVGCGQGVVMNGFRQMDAGLILRGYDSSPVALNRARARGLAVEALDIVAVSAAAAAGLARQVAAFDLALCLEVAEHIPAWHSDKLLAMLAGAPRLIFSAAQPNQGGRLHVNEQPPGHWIERLAARGFALSSCDAALRDDLQSLDVAWWYKRNVHVFERR